MTFNGRGSNISRPTNFLVLTILDNNHYKRTGKMQDLEFIKIGDDVLSLQEVLSYLKDSGNFKQLLSTILREHIIAQELKLREISAADAEVDQFILEFRLQNQIVDRTAFENWLSDNQLTYEKFREQATKGLKFQKLREQILQDKVEPFFEEKRNLFDRLVLSRLVVDSPNLSQNIRDILDREPSQFKDLIAEYSMADDRILEGRMGVFPREQLPAQLQLELGDKSAGVIIGPIAVDGLHCFFKIDQIIPSELDDAMRRELEGRLFEEWLRSKMQGANLQMLV